MKVQRQARTNATASKPLLQPRRNSKVPLDGMVIPHGATEAAAKLGCELKAHGRTFDLRKDRNGVWYRWPTAGSNVAIMQLTQREALQFFIELIAPEEFQEELASAVQIRDAILSAVESGLAV